MLPLASLAAFLAGKITHFLPQEPFQTLWKMLTHACLEVLVPVFCPLPGCSCSQQARCGFQHVALANLYFLEPCSSLGPSLDHATNSISGGQKVICAFPCMLSVHHLFIICVGLQSQDFAEVSVPPTTFSGVLFILEWWLLRFLLPCPISGGPKLLSPCTQNGQRIAFHWLSAHAPSTLLACLCCAVPARNVGWFVERSQPALQCGRPCTGAGGLGPRCVLSATPPPPPARPAAAGPPNLPRLLSRRAARG